MPFAASNELPVGLTVYCRDFHGTSLDAGVKLAATSALVVRALP